jgi:hypothetical protein
MSSVRGRHVPLTAAGIGIGGAMSVALGFMAFAGSDHPVGSLPFVALVSLPVVLATIGLRRPPALLAAGALSMPLSLLSLAGATLPLVVPGIFYLVAYGRAPMGRPRIPTALIVGFVIGSAALSLVLTYSDVQTVCTETIVGRNGDQSTREVDENGTHVLKAGGRGPLVASTSCSEIPPVWSVTTVLALFIGSGVLVAWMSKDVTPIISQANSE